MATRVGVAFQPFKVAADIRSVLIAQFAVLLQTLVDHPFQFRWQYRIQPRRWCRLSVQDVVENCRCRIARERQRPCCHFVHHCPKGEQVCPAIYLLAHVALRLRNAHTFNRQRLVLGIGLFALIPVGTVVPALATLAGVDVLLWAMIAYETANYDERRYRLRHGLDPDPEAPLGGERTTASEDRA